MDLHSLMRIAREAAGRAYAPYSGFPVGAAILTEGGTVFAGCNVENSSYGLSVCAERGAAMSMVASADGPLDREIRAVAVYGEKAAPCFPCGACRQFLREFRCKEVVLEDASGLRRYPFEEILPNSFGPEHL